MEERRRPSVAREVGDGRHTRVGAQRVEGAAGQIEDFWTPKTTCKPAATRKRMAAWNTPPISTLTRFASCGGRGLEGAPHPAFPEGRGIHLEDSLQARSERYRRIPLPRERERVGCGAGFRSSAVASTRELAPDGFIGVLVETTSMGLIVTKS